MNKLSEVIKFLRSNGHVKEATSVEYIIKKQSHDGTDSVDTILSRFRELSNGEHDPNGEEDNLKEGLVVPPILYHATYSQLRSSIEKEGLGGYRDKTWEDSAPGVVYLALDPNVAESHAEASDMGWDMYQVNDHVDIIMFRIDTSQLYLSLFDIDHNIIETDGSTLEYHGIIPPTALEMIERRGWGWY